MSDTIKEGVKALLELYTDRKASAISDQTNFRDLALDPLGFMLFCQSIECLFKKRITRITEEKLYQNGTRTVADLIEFLSGRPLHTLTRRSGPDNRGFRHSLIETRFCFRPDHSARKHRYAGPPNPRL